MGKEEKYKGATRVQPIEVVAVEVVDGECPDPRAMIRELGTAIQRMKNRMLFLWRLWHHEHGSGEAVEAWMREYTEWQRGRSAGRQTAERPKCPTEAMPKECAASVDRGLRSGFPCVHGRIVTLVVDRERKMLGAKAAKSAFPVWQRVLADYGESRSFSSPQPVPFDRSNVQLVQDEAEPDQWYLLARLDRVESKTRDGRPKAASTLLRLKLKTRGRNCQRIRHVLARCESGEWKYCGSSLANQDRLRVLWCYREAKNEEVALDAGKTAVLHASRRHPWTLRMEGRSRWVLGRARIVAHVRRQCGEQHGTRSESYRYGSESRRGHGTRRGVYRVKNLEDNLKKTLNQTATTAIVERLRAAGVGTLCFRQPVASVAQSRYLVTAGASPKRPGLWPWYQVEVMLAQKCQRAGIVFRKTARGTSVSARPGTKKPTRNGRKVLDGRK